QGVILPARPPVLAVRHRRCAIYTPANTNSSLDEKMPRPLRGHGMTQRVILRARPTVIPWRHRRCTIFSAANTNLFQP
ncbi:MAG: hypothetical protein ACK48C_01395, partial [Roseiflexaceae bacterium]